MILVQVTEVLLEATYDITCPCDNLTLICSQPAPGALSPTRKTFRRSVADEEQKGGLCEARTVQEVVRPLDSGRDTLLLPDLNAYGSPASPPNYDPW